MLLPVSLINSSLGGKLVLANVICLYFSVCLPFGRKVEDRGDFKVQQQSSYMYTGISLNDILLSVSE